MTKNEFIKRYNEVTEYYPNSIAGVFTCLVMAQISDECEEYYNKFMGSKACWWKISDFNKDGWNCEILEFGKIDRMFAMELFFHACLTEKWYKEF